MAQDPAESWLALTGGVAGLFRSVQGIRVGMAARL